MPMNTSSGAEECVDVGLLQLPRRVKLLHHNKKLHQYVMLTDSYHFWPFIFKCIPKYA